VSTQAERGERFRDLHRGDPFLIPNPWDAGSAKVMGALGFEALATTSAGFAFTLGRLDGGVSLDEVLEHTAALAEASDLPLSVDLENGYGAAPEAAATAVEGAAAAGAVGGSIEDWDPGDREIYPLDAATERVRAAAQAAAGLDFPFTLTARAENHLRGNPDIADTIARLRAFEEAGADVLYAPALRDADEVRTVCEAVSRPVNVLAHPGLSMRAVAEAGAQRVSVGSGLTWVAVGAMAEAALMLREGSFESLSTRAPIRDWLGG
jgi:2-methylisocitrate lyase-like PEP mutase family enzyme